MQSAWQILYCHCFQKLADRLAFLFFAFIIFGSSLPRTFIFTFYLATFIDIIWLYLKLGRQNAVAIGRLSLPDVVVIVKFTCELLAELPARLQL